MLEVKTHEVMGISGAMYGMRFPYESFDKRDTKKNTIGKRDMELGKKLVKGGSEHRKFLRMIHVQAEVNAPRYWWSEADTYHFMVKNSSSTMHLITKRPLEISDFSTNDFSKEDMEIILSILNDKIKAYNESQDKEEKRRLFFAIKQLLPEGFMQKRFIDTNYEELLNIYRQRKNHRLPEWHTFCDWIESLPYMKEFIGAMEDKA